MLPADRKHVSARMKPPPLESFRKSVRDWLFCWDSFVAAVNLAIVIVLVVLSFHVKSKLGRDAIALVAAFFVYRPVMYFVFPPLVMAVGIAVVNIIPHKDYTPYACPVCGYDVSETLSRCPECGTELRWGMLPDDPG